MSYFIKSLLFLHFYSWISVFATCVQQARKGMMVNVTILSCDSCHHYDRLTRTVLVLCLPNQPSQMFSTLEAFTVWQKVYHLCYHIPPCVTANRMKDTETSYSHTHHAQALIWALPICTWQQLDNNMQFVVYRHVEGQRICKLLVVCNEFIVTTIIN